MPTANPTTTTLRRKVSSRLKTIQLGHGVGHGAPAASGPDVACTIAAINLALDGRLTYARPNCVHPVIYAWVIPVQDRVSVEVLNSPEWRKLVPKIAGTVDLPDRLPIVLDAMWEALAWVQPVADRGGFGEAWAAMLRERTSTAANAARTAACTAAYDAADTAAAAYAAYDAAVDATRATRAANAANAAADAADAARAAYAAYAAAAAFDRWALDTLRKLVQP